MRSGVAVRPRRKCGAKCSMIRRYVGAAAWWNSSMTIRSKRPCADSRQGSPERLHGGEHYVGVRSPFVPGEESGVARRHDPAEDIPALAQYLLAVGNEENAFGTGLLGVERREPSLAQACREHDKTGSMAIGDTRPDGLQRLGLDRARSDESRRFRALF